MKTPVHPISITPSSQPELERFVTGQGQYTDDIEFKGQLYMAMVRSTHANATFAIRNKEALKKLPDVVDVLSSADRDTWDFNDLISEKREHDDAHVLNIPQVALFPENKTWYVGQVLCAVVATSLRSAQKACSLCEVAYTHNDVAVVSIEESKKNTPLVHERLGNNIGATLTKGSVEDVEKALKNSHKTFTLTIKNPRVVVNSMEPRCCNAVYDVAEKTYKLWASSQGVHQFQKGLKALLKDEHENIEVHTLDVGGAFGLKTNVNFPEYVLTLQAAKRLGRPVKWTNTRAESFVSDHGGRDNQKIMTIGVDKNMRFTALKIVNEVDIGAFATGGSPVGPLAASNLVSQGVYDIPHACSINTAYYTHKVPIGAYRGAWRPESIHALERMVDYVAANLQVAPDRLRLINAIGNKHLPYIPFTGLPYDSGDFPKAIEKALKYAKWDAFSDRLERSKEKGMLRGIGMAAYVEIVPMQSIGKREAKLCIHQDGTLTVYLGSNSSGTQIATTLKRYVADTLAVDEARVHVDLSSSVNVSEGAMSGGSTTTANSYQVVHFALEKLIEKAKALLAKRAGHHEIAYKDGYFEWGKNRVLLLDLPLSYPECVEMSVQETSVAKSNTYSSGCYVFEVEVHPQTGWVTVLDAVAVNDIGRVMNPMHVEGQIQGGVMQGLGQTLMEHAAYHDNGQPKTASFWNYALPKAEDICNIRQQYSTTLTKSNHFGIKGAGEVGTVATPPALANAVIHALKPYGVMHLDMPLTPEKIWNAIHHAKKL